MTEKLFQHTCDVRGLLILSSFFGGKIRGRCVQLTVGAEYVQMTFDDARTFFKDAIRAIDDTERRYNQTPPWWEKATTSK